MQLRMSPWACNDLPILDDHGYAAVEVKGFTAIRNEGTDGCPSWVITCVRDMPAEIAGAGETAGGAMTMTVFVGLNPNLLYW